MILIYTTLPTKQAAEALGEDLVNRKLAACVNIYPGMTSIYAWEGQTEREEEVGMFIKTAIEKADSVMDEVKRLHPYDTPALIQIKAEKVEDNYLKYLHNSVI